MTGPGFGRDASSVPPATIPHAATDCVEEACPEIVVQGDPPATLPGGAASPLRGIADPSIRRDPASDGLWMAYSWPSIHVDGDRSRTTRVETHLARSGDGGATWQAAGPLWMAEESTDPASGQSGWTDHEVPDLVPVGSGDDLRWVAARLDLFVPEGQGLGRRPPSSFRIGVLVAPTPPMLSAAEPVTLGSAATDSGWGVDIPLADLDPALSGCTVWNEPALHYDGSTLFMALRCLVLTGRGRPDVADSSVEVFATDPAGDVSTWQWRYQGRLAGHAEATALGGDGLTQTHFALDVDGHLVALLTPDVWDPGEKAFAHRGVRVVEVESLESPRLRRSPEGDLVVRASVLASDLGPLGPGASAYEPSSAAGVMLIRREIGPASLVGSLHATGVRP